MKTWIKPAGGYWGVGGATLLEVVIVVALLIVSVMTVSLIFPKATKNIVGNRQRMAAANFASSRMQELKAQPYAWVPLTPVASFSITSAYPLEGCDCKQENLSGAQFLDTQATPNSITDSGITYVLHACIHLVDRTGGAWKSYCPDGTSGPTGADKGLKNIRLRVLWTSGNEQRYTDMESLVFQ